MKNTDKFEITSNNGYGRAINENYKLWDNINSKGDSDLWKEKTRDIRFGTYQQFSFIDILDNFEIEMKYVNVKYYLEELRKVLENK